MTERERAVYELRCEQVPLRSVAQRLHLSDAVVRHICTTLKKKGLHLPHSRSLPPLKADRLRQLWAEKITVAEIAEMMNLSKVAIHGHARALNLPNRRDARGILVLLTPAEQKWLHNQAVGGLTINEIIAAIVRDAYAEEHEK